MSTAPTAGPAQCRVPPSTLISTTVRGTVIENVSPVVTYDTKSACMPPATPANPHETAKASILQRNVGTPSTSATSSSSWIANRPSPSRERRMACAMASVAIASASAIR